MSKARKIGTVVDEALYRRVRLESVRSGRQIREIVADALETHLASRPGLAVTGGAAASSFAILPIDRKKLRLLLDDEPGLFED